MKVAIITSGYLPVPASKGGAVENIVENFIIENEKYQKVEFNIFSIYDEDAKKMAEKYNYTKFHFIKPNKLVQMLDKLIYFFFKSILKKEKTMSYRYIMQRLYFLRKTSKKLKKENYDKVILENHATLFLTLKWHKNYIKYKDRYYYHIHNELKSLYGCKEIMKKTKNIMCVSNYVKKHVEEFLEIPNANNVKKLTNCINIKKFSNVSENDKNVVRKKYGISKNDFILIYTGRLTAQKGIRELLLAIKQLKTVENLKLLIVGSFFFDTDIKNDFEKEIKSIIEDIKDKVIFTGYVKYEEINKVYAIANVAVLPSIYPDSAPLTIIESMASGLPIITTDSGGIPEYAKDGCAFILKRDENLIENIKIKIQELQNDEDKRKEMASISIKNASELNLDNFYHNLLQAIE